MNETSAEYLQSLVDTRNGLAEILNNKNIEASTDESLNDLVEKVEKIHGGVEFGKWVPTVNTETLTVSGLPFIPYKIGISCESIANQSLYGISTRFISLFAANCGANTTNLYSSNIGELTMTNVPIGATVTITALEDGTYTLTVDFSEWNAVDGTAYLFKGGYEYMWVVSQEEWSI